MMFHCSWGSGLALLTVDVEMPHIDTKRIIIPCDAGPTTRALRSAFGDDVTGQEILFSVDNLGLLEAFAPIEVTS
jgi:hypothetical protein